MNFSTCFDSRVELDNAGETPILTGVVGLERERPAPAVQMCAQPPPNPRCKGVSPAARVVRPPNRRKVKAGVIDPAKVTKNALVNASSIAGLMITTEALVAEIPEEKKSAPPMPGGGGMGDMY